MGVDEAYLLSNIINEKVNDGTLNKEVLENIVITVNVAPAILYGIDKEFYRISHEGTTEGFKHTSKVAARIDNVRFVFNSTEEKS